MDRKKLLVIDEDPQVGEMLSVALALEMDVLTARSWDGAIQKAVSDHPHCILLDAMMPQVGGSVLCEILKSIRQTRWIPVVLMSTKPRSELWKMTQQVGALDYVEKPFSAEEISETIQRALEVLPVERRKISRVKAQIPVIIHSQDESLQPVEFSTEIEDVSQLGALVWLPTPMPIGQQMELRPSGSSGADRHVTPVRARVVWNDDDGGNGPYWHGIEFLDSSPGWIFSQ